MANNRGLLRNRLTPKTARIDESIAEEEISRMAYQLYEQRGRVEGHALDDWLQAEALLRRSETHRAGCR